LGVKMPTYTPTTTVQPIQGNEKLKELLDFLDKDIQNKMKIQQYQQQQKGIKTDEKTNEILGNELLRKAKGTPFEEEVAKLITDPYVDNGALTQVYSRKIQENTVNELLKKSTDGKLLSKDVVDAQARGLIDNNDASKLYPFATDYVNDEKLYAGFFDEETRNPSNSYREYINKAVNAGLKVSEVNSYWNETHPKARVGRASSGKTAKTETNVNVPQKGATSGYMFYRNNSTGNIVKIEVKKVKNRWVYKDNPKLVIDINHGNWVSQDSDELPRGSYERIKLNKIRLGKIKNQATQEKTDPRSQQTLSINLADKSNQSQNLQTVLGWMDEK